MKYIFASLRAVPWLLGSFSRSINNASSTPSNATVLYGTACKCKIGNLVTNNASYYTVNSTTSGTRKVDWYGSVNINQTPSSVNKITINYDGNNSVSKTQNLYLYNWVNSTWTQIDTRTVSTNDVTINKVQTSTPVNYVSSSGEIRLRVYSTGGTTNYICSGDWMQFIVESSELPVTGKNANVSVNSNDAISEELTFKSNPKKGENTIEYYLNTDAFTQIQLFDEFGKLIKVISEGDEKAGSHKVKFVTQKMKPGNYNIELKSGKFSKSIKFNIEK